MAFSALTTAQIAAGEPTAQELFQKTKDNFDNHESRITTLEGTNNVFRPYEFAVVGALNSVIVLDGLLFERVFFDQTVLGIKIFQNIAGSSGSTTIDVERKRGGGSWTSLLNSPLSIAFGDGDLAVASGTLSAATGLLAGDLLRLNVDAVQTGARDFTVFVEFEGA